MATISIQLIGSGAGLAQGLITQIIAAARARGVSQRSLAERAGISAESLSRLKKTGGCRLATALELARVAGFETIEIANVASGHGALSMSARKLSAGRRLPIGTEELILALQTGEPKTGQSAHLYGFFEELPIELVHSVILDEGLDYADLVSIAETLGAEGKTVDWLREMAGDRLADTS